MTNALDPEPLVSIAVPTIGRQAMLRRAVQSATSQGYKNLQIIVSDNASESGIAPYLPGIRDSRVIVRRLEARLSMAEHWNSCLSCADGTYFLLLSDDDYLLPSAIDELVRAIQVQDGPTESLPGLAYGRVRVITASDRPLWSTATGPSLEPVRRFVSAYFAHKRSLYPCATLFRTDALRKAGGYDGGRFGPAVDVAAVMSVALAAGTISAVVGTVACYTEHTQNLTKTLATEAWLRSFAEIKALIEERVPADNVFVRHLFRSMDSYVAYFVMDVAARTAKGSGCSPFGPIIEAVRAQRKHLFKLHIGALVRIVAKSLYLSASACLGNRT